MSQYSPFDKSIADLQPSDLAVLKFVSEGWYVDYKRDLIDSGGMAKALSAFANTYGGWLFFGVSELSKDDPVADEFTGLSDRDVDVARQRLRQSAAGHLNPVPFFQTSVLRGPCVEIGLPEDRSVVAVEIPQSPTAPHVHKDGRIYRRVADGSEPKPETDRFILDQLWRRAEPIREMTREWIERDPELSKSEGENPFLRLLFCVDPWQQRDPRLNRQIADIRGVLNSKVIGLPLVGFDTVYSTEDGFVARHKYNNDPGNQLLTWRMGWDMRGELVVPIPLYTVDLPDLVTGSLAGYLYGHRFIEILNKQGYKYSRIVDLNFVVNMLAGVVSQYRRFLNLAGEKGEFYFKVRVLNSWRVTPFVDAETVLQEFDQYGVPMVLDSEMTVPMGSDPDSFAHIREQDEQVSEHRAVAVQAMLLFRFVAMAFSVPFFAEEIPLKEFLATGERAMSNQEMRSQRRR